MKAGDQWRVEGLLTSSVSSRRSSIFGSISTKHLPVSPAGPGLPVLIALIRWWDVLTAGGFGWKTFLGPSVASAVWSCRVAVTTRTDKGDSAHTCWPCCQCINGTGCKCAHTHTLGHTAHRFGLSRWVSDEVKQSGSDFGSFQQEAWLLLHGRSTHGEFPPAVVAVSCPETFSSFFPSDSGVAPPARPGSRPPLFPPARFTERRSRQRLR